MRRGLAAACAAVLLGAAAAAQAGSWGLTRTLQGPFAVSSPPAAPLVAVNAHGHALLAWNATGLVAYAERQPGGTWQPSAVVPGGGSGAGPVAVAIGSNEVAAIAWVTAATRYVPAQLMVSLRAPGSAFLAPVQAGPGTGVYELRAGVACDGSVTLLWNDAVGVASTTLPGSGGTGACDGRPGSGPWPAPVLLSDAHVGAGLPDLALNDAGSALAVWQQGAAGSPAAVLAAQRPAGGAWQPAVAVSPPTGAPTWNPKPALDAAGNAAVGYLDGSSMRVVRRAAAGAWGLPETVSGTQNVTYPALAMSAAGDLLAAWQALDAAGRGTVWQRLAPAGAPWAPAGRLSAPGESAGWPSAAFAGNGGLAAVGWADDASLTARAAVWSAGTWTRTVLGSGWWGGTVPVGAGGPVAAAGWAVPAPGNPNSARLVARAWQ